VNNFFKKQVDRCLFSCYIIPMKMNVTLESHSPQFASRRTINRILQHGPEFRALKSGNCPVLGDGLHWLVRSEDGWLGWLPKAEFRFFTIPGMPGPSKCASNVNNFSLDN